MGNDEELNKMNNQILALMKRVKKKYSQYDECKAICWSCQKTSEALLSIRVKEAKTEKQNENEIN